MNHLIPFWFTVIAILWTGFFILEGFDFGVGMLHSFVGQDEAGRRAAINTIGPLWDGNEVWLIVAAAAMFAAFPGWYATMFSGMYLAMVLLLAALIIRGVAFEYRAKRDAASWRRTWDVLLTAGSVLAPLLIGIALGGILYGLPINSAGNFTGSFADLFPPYALFTGVTLVAVCALHGATFLSLKTTGDMHQRARQLARYIAPVTCALVIGFAIWTHVTHTTASCIVSIFTGLYPNVMVSSTKAAYNLTVHNTASAPYALKVMTVVVIILLPVVLAYQAWTYYVFRRRISAAEFQPVPRPRGESPGAPSASPVTGDGGRDPSAI